jgi:hypothetical protein
MESIRESKGKKVHTRKIEISSYDYDEQRIIVEGVLKDDRFQDSYGITGEKFPKGVIHHMAIRLLVNCSNLMIEDFNVEPISLPHEACRETFDCLAAIKGMTITRGFTLKIKKMAGGERGCTHLVELLLAMAPTVVQGAAAHQSQKMLSFDYHQTKAMLQFLTNTCRVWREDGPFVAMFKNALKMKQAKEGNKIEKSI